MIDGWLLLLTAVAALGCAAAGGILLAFSTFVMKALARLPSAQGIAAMQSINVAAVSPLFMVVLFGTALACVVLGVASLAVWQKEGAGYLLAGSLLYLVGVIFVTVVYHVPRNDALAAIDPNGEGSASHWNQYVKEWTTWNHLRSVAGLGAAGLLVLALRTG
jgi:uncharacterized membrane protein